MKQVAVYGSAPRSNTTSKQALIYESIDLALDALDGVAWQRHEMPAAEGAADRPGLQEVRPFDKVVALGRVAHTLLADYRKRTLVVDADDEAIEEDLERLVWSCLNTSRVVALGGKAWRSVQMLPVAERNFHQIPPLRIGRGLRQPMRGVGDDVLVINHMRDDRHARQVGDVLACGGYRVELVGRAIQAECRLDKDGWSSTAAIHVHVGCHTMQAEEMRLVDSWHSQRFAILMLPHHQIQHPLADSLMVDPDVSGFLCSSPDKVLAACADIGSDPVLRKKMLHAGACAVSPLARQWLTVAEELVA